VLARAGDKLVDKDAKGFFLDLIEASYMALSKYREQIGRGLIWRYSMQWQWAWA